MTRHVISGLVTTAIFAVGGQSQPSLAAGTACANLAQLTIPNITVNAATMVAPGFTPPGPQLPGANASPLPAFCRVEATARPTSDSEIKFEVCMPPVDACNGTFHGVGNGGYQGPISYSA